VEALIDTAGKSLWQLVTERAEASPDVLMAVDMQGRTMTFGEFRARAERAAAGFAALGVGEGTPVSWVLPSRFEAFVLTAALARLGAQQNPILPIYREREVGFMASQTRCRLMVVPGTFRDFDYTAMAAAATEGLDATVFVADPDLPDGDPATLGPPADAPTDAPTDAITDATEATGAASDPVRWIMYTSGTVADPKGARHTDASIAWSNVGMQWSMRVTSDDRVAVVFPITHVGGLVWLFNTMETGCRLLMVEIFSPATAIPFLAEQGVTCAGAGTAFHLAYLEAQRRQPGTRLFPNVRLFNGGGAPKPVTLHYEMLEEMGAPVISGWGLTESPIITMVPLDAPDHKKAETEGQACPGVQVRAVSPDDERDVGRGEEGELRVKAGQVCLGYLDSSLDAAAFDADGWFRTGDLGVIDDEGYVTITGRLKDIIIRKGENISAKEVEDLLFTHPDVADVAVIGLPDSASGERVCAVVVCNDGATLALRDVTDYLGAQGLITRKLPEQLELVDALPRNPTGKILKRELQERFRDPA
jgi:acyl-CoA synthetase (AMP-forming)/AMP-acid ligase II